jgi:hypothetical protein
MWFSHRAFVAESLPLKRIPVDALSLVLPPIGMYNSAGSMILSTETAKVIMKPTDPKHHVHVAKDSKTGELLWVILFSLFLNVFVRSLILHQ